MTEAEEVYRLYGEPGLSRLFAAARERLERRGLEVGGWLTLQTPSAEERVAVARLLGSARVADEGGLRISLVDLDAELRGHVLGLGLADVLEVFGGPLAPRVSLARARATAQGALFEDAADHPALTRHPVLADWLAWLRARGALARFEPDAARALLHQALDVCEALPAVDLSLPVFAGRITGRTHALDRGAPLALLVDRALAFIADVEPTPAMRREMWAGFGVSLDAVSSTALVLNLRSRGSKLDTLLGAAAEIGEPAHVTLRMLEHLDRLDVGGVSVSLCENRSIIEAVAERLGPSSAPVICLSGEPTMAGRRLVELLRAGGARMRYHGDFDQDGIAIANSVIGQGVAPWRYDADSYLAAVARTPVRDELGPGSVGASWDTRLADAMSATGARIYEEQVLDDLLADLRPGPSSTVPHPAAGPDEAPDSWVAASRTRNSLLGDPLCDWLRLYGEAAGFVRDDALPGYDARTDFRRFILEQGQRFEAGVMRLLADRTVVRAVASGPGDAASAACALTTIDAMQQGLPVISQGVLHDSTLGVFGMPDLLVRADVLADLFPDTLEEGGLNRGSPRLAVSWHYRVVDVKFHRFELLRDGHASAGTDSLPFLAQAWLYNHALGETTGYRPPAAYLLGRGWKQGDERGQSCLERLARVDDDRWLEHRGTSLELLALRAVDWVRRVREEGASWQVLPRPSTSELYPNMRHTDDGPWHAAKRQIAGELRDLTELPRINPDMRAAAHAVGIMRWDDERVTAASVGVRSEAYAVRLDAVIKANQSPAPVVLPERFLVADPAWRSPAPVEFFVDFETVSDLADDFSALPTAGGQALIFQIGCGHLDVEGVWSFAQWTTDRLDVDEEGRIIGEWLTYLAAVASARGCRLDQARIYHWSPAETSTLETAHNAARTRHADAGWPDPEQLQWFDLLGRLARAEPLTATGAFGFGLKAVAKALAAQGLIVSTWGDGPTDGLGAMVGAWWCDAEARRLGRPMHSLELMREIAAYNEIDCRVMAEILAWLRDNR